MHFDFIVGIAEKATTVQVAVQTPPSRRKHPSAPHIQTKMPVKTRSYEPGTANKERDSKSRPHMNQILPQGNCDFKQIALQINTNLHLSHINISMINVKL